MDLERLGFCDCQMAEYEKYVWREEWFEAAGIYP